MSFASVLYGNIPEGKCGGIFNFYYICSKKKIKLLKIYWKGEKESWKKKNQNPKKKFSKKKKKAAKKKKKKKRVIFLDCWLVKSKHQFKTLLIVCSIK